MVPVEPVNANDEGYTSSPTESQCSLVELPSGSGLQEPLIKTPSGTGEPLFPRFQELEDVSVTPVTQASGIAAQNERKQQEKGRGFRERRNREGIWKRRSQHNLSSESHGQAPAYCHRKVKIPPLPKNYSLMALNQKYYKNPPLKLPELSEEEKHTNMIESMRNEVVGDEGPSLIPPRSLPSEVHFFGFTEDGTVMIKFLDAKNETVFRKNEEKIDMWFGQNEVLKLDTRIRKDDVSEGRLVLAKVPQPNGSYWNVRAMVSDFNDRWILVDGVDYPIRQRKLSYDNVFYQLKDFNFSPFQMQEVHLDGLENYEGSPVLRFIIRRADQAFVKWAEENRLTLPDKLLLKKIQKGKNGYKVRLDFPEEFLGGFSLNKVLMEGIKNFDPFIDYLVTP